jgi:FtsP/CotA-like multicopper oxidase with cupredoxin domain
MHNLKAITLAALALLLLGALPAAAIVNVQCPGDTDGDGIIDTPDPAHPNAKCMHLSSGDGFVTMGDGRTLYMFGFADMTGVPEADVMEEGMFAAASPAPLIVMDQGDEFYLNLTNVGMFIRPDLFDPHTIHFHGYPNASAVFDGVPESSVSINAGSTLTYYYLGPDPGTYMYHCHVEATEHMQMGMLGNLYVRPQQNKTGFDIDGDGSPDASTRAKLGGGTNANAPQGYTYNDGDGSTAYDVEFPLQLVSFDAAFHDASETVQPLPFALMKDDYPMINGRGYPDTVNPNPLPGPDANGNKVSQPLGSLVKAKQGEKILLRISNINVTRFHTLTSPSIPMRVVGKDAKLLRGPTGRDLTYMTNAVTLGGGESYDVILDTAGVAPGIYFLYAANLNMLSNGTEDFGGMMTEIRLTP